jgi:anti-anti-sigma regulatory factor
LGIPTVVDDASNRRAATVFVTGPVTLAEAPGWREDLADGLARFDGLRLDLGRSGPWDLAGAQVLLSLRVSTERMGVSLKLANVPVVFMTVVERSGLLDQFLPLFEDGIR